MLYNEFVENTKEFPTPCDEYTNHDFYKSLESVYMGTHLRKKAVYEIANLIIGIEMLVTTGIDDDALSAVMKIRQSILDGDFQ